MKPLLANDILENGTPVRVHIGNGYHGIVKSHEPAPTHDTCPVHTIELTERHNGLSGRRSAWIPCEREWRGSYRFVSVFDYS